MSYAYDAVGNRTSLTVNGGQTTNTFDAADRLTQSGTTTYTYDASGNELTKTASGAASTYSYDPLGRLTGIGGPTTASYSYNGDGVRVAKTVNSVTTSYTWDPTGLGQVLSDGTSQYLWGQGLVGAVTGAATSYVQADGLGSVRLVTGAAGTTLGSASYDAYGSSRSTSGTQLPFGFTGEQQDAESGLLYLRARYYDPSSGRFLTRDTFPGTPGEPQSLDRYTYVSDTPTVADDPSGHCFGPLLAVCIAWGVADAAPVLLAMGAAIVSSPVLVAMISEQVQGARQDVDTLLCPSASSEDKLGAAASLTLAALALTPEGDAYAESAADAARLQKSLASAQQMSEVGRAIIGAGARQTLYDAPRLAATYGGRPEDWAKMVSSSYTAIDGTRFETHWYENVVTGERVEYKTKFQ